MDWRIGNLWNSFFRNVTLFPSLRFHCSSNFSSFYSAKPPLVGPRSVERGVYSHNALAHSRDNARMGGSLASITPSKILKRVDHATWCKTKTNNTVIPELQLYCVWTSTCKLHNTYPHLNSIINDNYQSKLFVSNISYVENYKQVKNRVFPFIQNLCQEHKNKDTVILIVTHATILNTIRKFFDSDIHFEEHVEEAKPFIIDVPENLSGPSGYCWKHMIHCQML